jgi:hypothetical protein
VTRAKLTGCGDKESCYDAAEIGLLPQVTIRVAGGRHPRIAIDGFIVVR